MSISAWPLGNGDPSGIGRQRGRHPGTHTHTSTTIDPAGTSTRSWRVEGGHRTMWLSGSCPQAGSPGSA
jgi:hypothetical protein